jgi:betaine reductase
MRQQKLSISMRRLKMGKLSGKKLILLGERDGVPSPAMEACFAGSGAEVVFSATECFV